MKRFNIQFIIASLALLLFSCGAEARNSINQDQDASEGTISSSTQWTTRYGQPLHPALQGASMGTIGPNGGDATVVTGIMTAGTVRVNSLANLEAGLNIAANAIEIIWFLFGAYHFFKLFKNSESVVDRKWLTLANSLAFTSMGLLTPAVVNWMVATARDAALF